MQSPNFQVFIGKLRQLIKCYTIKSSVTYLGVLRSLATYQIHLGSSLFTWEIFSEQDLKETAAANFFSYKHSFHVYFSSLNIDLRRHCSAIKIDASFKFKFSDLHKYAQQRDNK